MMRSSVRVLLVLLSFMLGISVEHAIDVGKCADKMITAMGLNDANDAPVAIDWSALLDHTAP